MNETLQKIPEKIIPAKQEQEKERVTTGRRLPRTMSGLFSPLKNFNKIN